MMRSRIAFVLCVLALLILMLTSPVLASRFVFLSPALYQHWFRESDIVSSLSTELAHSLPRQVPADSWTPWIPRAPETLRAFLSLALNPSEIEAALVRGAPSWVRWSLGEAERPPHLTDEITPYLQGPAGERLRAFLWESLPPCGADVDPVACIPLEAGARPAVGFQQRAWWDAFIGDTVAWLDAEEMQLFASWPGFPEWVRWIWYAPAPALVFAAAAFALESGRRRWVCLAIPLLGAGLFSIALGGVGLFGILTPWDAWAVMGQLGAPHVSAMADMPFGSVITALWPSLWNPFSRLMGSALVVTGALALALGLCFAFLVVEGRRGKGLVLMTVVLALGGAFNAWPNSPFAALPALPAAAFAPTPTPWPTFTSTPTITPTPYWPVAPGTPLPTPSGSFALNPERLGCYDGDPDPALALQVTEGEVQMIQARRMSRLRFADLAKIGTVENPVTATIVAIDRLGREAALSWDHDLYFFELPGWSRALQSRVSTFSLIQAMVFVGEGNRLVLGLDNGYLWVVNPSTGGLLWLHATQAGSLTALAAHPTRPWILAGSTDRTVRLWNLGTQEEVAVFQGHSGDVAALAFSPQGDRAISADDQGKVILWDLEQGRMLAQRVLTGDSITRLVWTDEAVVGGTMQGNLVLSSEALEMTLLPAFESAVTALAVKSPGYLVAGSQDGRVCVWATLRP